MSTTATPYHKQIMTTIKSVNPTTREIEFIPTHQLVDGDGEVVLVDGMQTSRYALNPVLCYGHDVSRVIGRTIALIRRTVAQAPALVARAVLPTGIADSDLAYDLISKDLLRGISIGFLSLDQGPPVLPGQTGVTHVRSELLEISLVAIPSCPTCVISSKTQRTKAAELIEFDQHEFSRALRQVINESLSAKVHAATRQAIAELCGRID